MHINVWKNGVCVGYIQSVSYTKGTYKVTKDVSRAKTYRSETSVMSDIEFCTRVSTDFPVFTYN